MLAPSRPNHSGGAPAKKADLELKSIRAFLNLDRLEQLYERGDPTVVAAMLKYRELTDRGREALMSGDWTTLGRVMDENFDLRRTFMAIAPENQRMIDVARSTGASAKFTGSGGAICGLYKDGKQYQQLVDAMASIRCNVIRPIIFEDQV